MQRNRDFWSSFSPKESSQKILIESPSIPMITHLNGIFSIVLNQAKCFTPVWSYNPNWDVGLLKSYVPTAKYTKTPEPSRIDKWRIFFIATLKFLIIFLTRDILSFSYDGVRYGDIVYDVYLKKEQVATVRKIDITIFRILASCIRRHNEVRRLLENDDFKAVMVSHQVGMHAGVMLRAALRCGYKAYLRAGDHTATLQCFERLDEILYHHRPLPKDIDAIIRNLGSELYKIYNLVAKRVTSGEHGKDGVYAFSPNNKYYSDRKAFVEDFGLNPAKKNVFVMLHAFNDHPHSHFKWMIFRDYYDWFVKTLGFAKTSNTVNWIFKQHPSIRFYSMKDVSFERLFEDVPDNVVYIGEENQIDTRSLIACADVVITCTGSAGFELPAMAGIPSIVAGDTFYAGLGFAMEPTSKKEYFKILRNLSSLGRLTPQEQKRAQAAYIFIYEFSLIPVPACPRLTYEEEKDRNQNSWYWRRVNKLYERNSDVIIDEIRNYVSEVAKPGFKRLVNWQNHCDLG